MLCMLHSTDINTSVECWMNSAAGVLLLCEQILAMACLAPCHGTCTSTLAAAGSLQRCRAPLALQRRSRAFLKPLTPNGARRKSLAAYATLVLKAPEKLATVDKKLQRAQQTILEAIRGSKGRGKDPLSEEQLQQFNAAVEVLEANGGVKDPTTSPLLNGRWRLLYTTRPGTASPIQRTFTGVDKFQVFQDIELEEGQPARVNNVVDFGPSVGYLKVEAEASTDTRPIPGFVPRRGAGLPFGILGVSSTYPPARENLRVDFQFDSAAFTFTFLPFKIPYPVPFRLLQDERKGWIDITYMSPDGRFRLSRGNKGTLFVLAKEQPLRERLLETVASGGDAGVEDLIDELERGGRGAAAPARSPLTIGKWRLQWTKQGPTANPLQRNLAGRVRNYQVIYDNGRLDNLVEFASWLRIRASAACEPQGAARTGVAIDAVTLEIGSLKIPLNIRRDAAGYIDWLYLDENVRVSRGNKGSVFVHTRDE